jgi:hypothetical protein
MARDGDESSEIVDLIAALCDAPLSEERVISTLLPWLDESKADSRFIACIIGATAPFSRSGAYAERLTESYWRVVSTANDRIGFLADVISRVWKDHPLAPAYLRRTPEIANDAVRSKVASTLIGHPDFDPQKEAVLLDGLLKDRAEEVRYSALWALCARKTLPLRFRVTKALPYMDPDSSIEVRRMAMSAILGQIETLPVAEADGLLTDPSFGLADRMLAGLKEVELGTTIAIATGRLSGNVHEFVIGLDEDGQVAKAVAWWEEVKKGEVTRLAPEPGKPPTRPKRPPQPHALPSPER